MLQRAVSNLRALKIQADEVFPVLQRSDSFIGDEFRIAEIQIADAREQFSTARSP